MSNEPAEPTDSATDPGPKGGFFKDWVVPIVVGLGIGAGIVLAWNRGGELFESDVWKIAQGWESDAWQENDQLAADVRKLGKDARADVLDAFRKVEVPANPWNGEFRMKIWLGTILAGDPFLDARSLLEIAQSGTASVWDRRCAAAALVTTLRKDVNVAAVIEPLLTWLEDLTVHEHRDAWTPIRYLRTDDLFPPDQEERLRRAILRLAARDARPKPDDPEDEPVIATDRALFTRELKDFVSFEDVKAALWKASGDESDDSAVRSFAIQALAHGNQFDDIEAWKRLTASADDTVRQTVADNGGLAKDPAFDSVLAPLHVDESALVRLGSIDSQVVRGRATMLPVIDVLLEDASPFVRRAALIACGRFKDHAETAGARMGMALRLLESSDADEDVEGAAVALFGMTGQSFGIAPADIETRPGREQVREEAIAAFKADEEGRRVAVAKWRALVGGAAVWTDADRAKTLAKLETHADPENREHAKAELAKLRGGEKPGGDK